jgi:hypothetical protein
METVRVRVRLMIDSKGKWAAYSYSGCTDDEADSVLFDMLPDGEIETARIFVLTADVPMPEIPEIPADVEPVEPNGS